MSSAHVLPLIIEVRDPEADRASTRLARLATAAVCLATLLPFVAFAERPEPHLPMARALVVNLRLEDPEVPRQRPLESDARRLLAENSPESVPQVEKKPDPPRVTAPPEQAAGPKKVERKRERRREKPERAERPKQRRPVPNPDAERSTVAATVGKGSPQAGVAGGSPDGARVEVSAASKQRALAVLMEAIEKNKRYPRQARRSGAQGTVTLSIRIDSHGRVRQAAVSRNCGVGSLDQESARLAERLRGLDTGVTGAAFTVLVPVRYRLTRG